MKSLVSEIADLEIRGTYCLSRYFTSDASPKCIADAKQELKNVLAPSINRAKARDPSRKYRLLLHHSHQRDFSIIVVATVVRVETDDDDGL